MDKASFVQLEQGELGARKTILQTQFASTGHDIDRGAANAEDLSRRQFAELWIARDCPGVRPNSCDSSKLPDGLDDRLAEMNYLSQYAALRKLHEEIKEHGESPELLGAVVRGYANLGTLTEHLWVIDARVYKARALLYAERLLRRLPGELGTLASSLCPGLDWTSCQSA